MVGTQRESGDQKTNGVVDGKAEIRCVEASRVEGVLWAC